MLENAVVSLIESQLGSRWYVNFHGNMYTQTGTSDILTCDNSGRLVGIEVKRPGAYPSSSQIRKGLQIVKSGGRFIVAYDDFDIESLDRHSLPLIEIPYVFSEIPKFVKMFKRSTEVVMKDC